MQTPLLERAALTSPHHRRGRAGALAVRRAFAIRALEGLSTGLPRGFGSLPCVFG